MIELIKSKIWAMLKKKEVSLAMIYDRSGDILWHRGRKIAGKSIYEGEGFSRSFIRQTLAGHDTDAIEKDRVVIDSSLYGLPESAFKLLVRSLLIQPIGSQYFLYVDSGAKKSFTKTDRELFKCLGEVLGEMIAAIRSSEGEPGGITGNSPGIDEIREKVVRYSLEEQPILLLGETGVGKSHVAELIHRYSGRKGKFVTVHTPGIPENLFESEIFGYKKGAFTDARADKKGLVDEAAGGTLFFDEISEVPVVFQARLLRFIDTRRYLVLGESVEKESDVRIVAATNRDLSRAINEKEFREDLYYRLNILSIEIPPLRKRKEDIKALVLEKRELLKGKEMGEGFWEAICDYDWPGNIRELMTVLLRAGIECADPITGEGIRALINRGSHKTSFTHLSGKVEQIWQDIESGKEFWQAVWLPFINRDIDRETIKEILRRAYNEAHSNFKRMINILSLDKKEYHSFMSLMRKYRIDPRS